MKIHFWPDLLALIAIFHCMLSYNYFNPNSYYIANLSGWLVGSFLEYNSTFYQWFKGVNACDWTTSVYLYFMDNLKGVNAWDFWDTKEISSTKLQIHAYLILLFQIGCVQLFGKKQHICSWLWLLSDVWIERKRSYILYLSIYMVETIFFFLK